MEDYFSIGELSRYQNISKQTLIFYDKLGLFQPAYVDPNNGYRYYTARQLDELDTILILKKSGLSLQRIKELLEHYTTESSQKVLREQLGAIDRQMEELRLLRSRLSQRCSQLEDANLHKGEPPRLEVLEEQYLLTRPVEAPYSLREISIATKQCFAQAFQEELPIFFQSGVRVPLERILAKRYTEASTAFLPIEKTSRAGNIQRLPGGLCATLYHRGDYLSIGATYESLLPGAAAEAAVGFLRVLRKRLHHHRGRERVHHPDSLFCGTGGGGMIPLSFGDIALLNHLLEERGTRYQVRWKDSFNACLEPPGECCFTPELQREALGLVERFYREKGLAVVFSPDKLFFSVKGLEGPGKPGCPAE